MTDSMTALRILREKRKAIAESLSIYDEMIGLLEREVGISPSIEAQQQFYLPPQSQNLSIHSPKVSLPPPETETVKAIMSAFERSGKFLSKKEVIEAVKADGLDLNSGNAGWQLLNLCNKGRLTRLTYNNVFAQVRYGLPSYVKLNQSTGEFEFSDPSHAPLGVEPSLGKPQFNWSGIEARKALRNKKADQSKD